MKPRKGTKLNPFKLNEEVRENRPSWGSYRVGIVVDVNLRKKNETPHYCVEFEDRKEWLSSTELLEEK